MYEDKTLVCKECGSEFVFTAGEQEFYAEKGFVNEPQRCKECRQARKNAARGAREMHETVCAECGGVAKIPFKPMEGKESLVPEKPELKWFDNDREASDETVQLFDTLLSIISSSGIKIDYSDDLNGALGVSSGGNITLLKNLNKNIEAFKTLTHEFAHELLHQKYLQASGNDGTNNGWAEYFIGREGGRKAIEQQAELVAWIVCRFFGYDEPTSINYVAMWGMDKTNASRVFDTVAKVASMIYTKISENLSEI